MIGFMLSELAEFDKRNPGPLPAPIKRWRDRWIREIERLKEKEMKERLSKL